MGRSHIRLGEIMTTLMSISGVRGLSRALSGHSTIAVISLIPHPRAEEWGRQGLWSRGRFGMCFEALIGYGFYCFSSCKPIIVATSDVQFPWQDRDVEVSLLTVFITWAGLRLLQSVLDASTQYSLVGRETFWLFVRLILKFVVAVAWTVLFSVFYARIWQQKNADGVWSRAADERIITFLKVVFVYVMPESLAIVLFIVPWLRNWIEELNLGVVYLLTWWFYSKSFVGRGMREGVVDNFKYSIFWVIVLATKFIFSYFLQIRPLIAPTRALLNLKNASYN